MRDEALDPNLLDAAGQLMCQARRVLAYDNFDSLIQKPLLYDEGQAFPQFVETAEGCTFTDTLGRTYIDWVNGGGPVLLGHRRPEVEAAIIEQMRAGPNLPLMHPLEIEVATLLTEMVPCADVVAFGKNGSDGLTGATRLARAITGGDVILYYGMHGFHDWFVSSNPVVRGVPDVLRPLIHPFDYNDLEGLEQLLERFRGRVAAVVMEPIREIQPEPGYMAAVGELVRSHGALWIWDEVVTALRLGPGGAQTFLGVEPDLACLGKALANGMPISALVGKHEYMSQTPATAFGMTFRGETLTLAAARATLTIVRDEPVAAHVARIGERVREAFAEACAKHDVHARLNGPAARMTFGFDDDGGLGWEAIQRLFLEACIQRGVFTNGNILPSYAHDDAAVERTAKVFDGALAEVEGVLTAARRMASGGPPTAAGRRRALRSIGSIETLGVEDGKLVIGGWALLTDAAPDAVVGRLELDDPKVWTEAAPVERHDVGDVHPGRTNSERAGYLLRLDLPDELPGRLVVLLRFECAGAPAFFVRIVIEEPRPEEGSWPGPFWTGDGVVHVGSPKAESTIAVPNATRPA